MEILGTKCPSMISTWAQVNPGCLLEVDGGIDPNTAPIVKENGATVLVSGSAYFKAADRDAFVRMIRA